MGQRAETDLMEMELNAECAMVQDRRGAAPTFGTRLGSRDWASSNGGCSEANHSVSRGLARDGVPRSGEIAA